MESLEAITNAIAERSSEDERVPHAGPAETRRCSEQAQAAAAVTCRTEQSGSISEKATSRVGESGRAR
jgi:hypothetical protein